MNAIGKFRGRIVLLTMAALIFSASLGSQVWAQAAPPGGSPPMPPPGPNGALPPGIAPAGQQTAPAPPAARNPAGVAGAPFAAGMLPPAAPLAAPLQAPPPGTVASLNVGDRAALDRPDSEKGTVVRIGGAGDPPVYKDCYAIHMDYDFSNPNSVEWACTRTGARVFKLDAGGASARVLPPPPIGFAPAGAPQDATLEPGRRLLFDNQKGTVIRVAAAGDAPVYVANGCYAVHFDYDFNNPGSVQWFCLKTMTSRITVLDGSDKPVGEVRTGR